MGHSQFAEYIGARGPNTHVNAACASTAQAVALAEDWIRTGRCRRVIVIGADDVTSDNLMEWVGAGFLATGAAATDDKVEEAALPFDRRRHGTILGMGACALVVESEDAVRERGMRGIVEVLSSETANSAFHGTRLDVEPHLRRDGTAGHRRRAALRPQPLRHGARNWSSSPTRPYTPARGGSAAAEVAALRHTFGEAADEIVVSNTKGFTGHPMGVGVEDVIAVKILEYGIVPPVPNYKEVDPDLGVLNLSRGGRYPVQYALHLAAGFGSQIAMTLHPAHPRRPRPRGQQAASTSAGWPTSAATTRPRPRSSSACCASWPRARPSRRPAPAAGSTAPARSCARTAPGGGALTDYRPLPMPAVRRGEGRDARSEVAAAAPVAPVRAPAPAPAPMRPANQRQRPGQPRRPNLCAQWHRRRRAGRQCAAAPVAPAPCPAPARTRRPSGRPGHRAGAGRGRRKTGYPKDMLDLDLDLEADLGIDTVKQAETFAAVREAFDIPCRKA